jgi:hypothetical protein
MKGYLAIALLFGVSISQTDAQEVRRLSSVDWIPEGQTFLCMFDIMNGDRPSEHQYALTCQDSMTDDAFWLACILEQGQGQPEFVCPVGQPLPFIDGSGLRLSCESTPEEWRSEMRRSLVMRGLPLSTPVPSLKCSSTKFDIPWEDMYGEDP